MDPQKLRKLVRRWTVPVVLITLVGGVVAYALTRRMTPIYEAQATVLVVAGPQQAGANTGVSLNPDQVTATAATLMAEPPILQRVINELKLDVTTEQLARNVIATPVTNAELVNVTVQNPDPALGTRIANTLTADFVDQVTQQNTQRINQAGAAFQGQINALNTSIAQEESQLANAPRGQDTTGVKAEIAANSAQLTTLTATYGTFRATQAQNLETVSVAAPASQPNQPSSPKLALNVALGVVAGLIVALSLATLAEYLDQGLDSEDDVRERLGVPCLATVPRFNSRPGAPRDQRHEERARESYRRLRTNLLFSELDSPLKTIVVTSARPGEGKTRTASNLAVSLASSEKSVLLIDADMHRPNQHRIFSKPITQGLSEMLLAAAATGHPVLNGRHETTYANLSVLTSGVLPPNPSELLASRRTRLLIHGLEKQRDILIIDTPPAQALTDALSVAAHSSGVILVVESGKTNAADARAVIDSLQNVGAKVLGVVLNKAKDRQLASYYYYEQAPTSSASALETTGAAAKSADEAIARP
ncbi:MAG: polysaccharide biosynthesis tyrosine autokinase [Candidatus Dormibacteraeota bacterium]|uniref:Polysaccharide biosynthesis tyrosine autokinase n=1 Tax=Candidatus Aeolococcus gillhamiae TaxID=3127015 RepID=A0A934K0J2_9BACT|nr:polysaccharide biosynthesis tyrosine autokinase [Candidatus Dormibacteraeota bacterium]